MKPVAIVNHTAVSALGQGRAAHAQALRSGRTGLVKTDFETARLGAWLGIVAGVDEVALPAPQASFDCRNNRLAEMALQQDGFEASVARARARFGAGRVGVFVGTSTSGLLSLELAYRDRGEDGRLPESYRESQTRETSSLAQYLKARLGLQGPAFVISTACSSGAKAFSAAARMMRLGLIDAAVVGGVDSLCLTTLYGFRSLELLSDDICRPWDAERAGISIGEGAAFSLLERDAQAPRAWLRGTGESSDAHHMSTPHPEGAGAAAAMREALASAGADPQEVGYVNLHGTGTRSNDAAEDKAVLSVFGPGTDCSSTKGYTGHTLGAAGALEATISMLAIEQGFVPAGINRRDGDPALGAAYQTEIKVKRLDLVVSNSFGFGGSNASLVFGSC